MKICGHWLLASSKTWAFKMTSLELGKEGRAPPHASSHTSNHPFGATQFLGTLLWQGWALVPGLEELGPNLWALAYCIQGVFQPSGVSRTWVLDNPSRRMLARTANDRIRRGGGCVPVERGDWAKWVPKRCAIEAGAWACAQRASLSWDLPWTCRGTGSSLGGKGVLVEGVQTWSDDPVKDPWAACCLLLTAQHTRRGNTSPATEAV